MGMLVGVTGGLETGSKVGDSAKVSSNSSAVGREGEGSGANGSASNCARKALYPDEALVRALQDYQVSLSDARAAAVATNNEGVQSALGWLVMSGRAKPGTGGRTSGNFSGWASGAPYRSRPKSAARAKGAGFNDSGPAVATPTRPSSAPRSRPSSRPGAARPGSGGAGYGRNMARAQHEYEKALPSSSYGSEGSQVHHAPRALLGK